MQNATGSLASGSGTKSNTKVDVANGPLRVRMTFEFILDVRVFRYLSSCTPCLALVCSSCLKHVPPRSCRFTILHLTQGTLHLNFAQEVRNNKLPVSKRPVTANYVASDRADSSAAKRGSAPTTVTRATMPSAQTLRPRSAGQPKLGAKPKPSVSKSNISQATRNRIAARAAASESTSARPSGTNSKQPFKDTSASTQERSNGEMVDNRHDREGEGLLGANGSGVRHEITARHNHDDSGSAVISIVGTHGARSDTQSMIGYHTSVIRQKPAEQPLRSELTKSSIEWEVREKLDELDFRAFSRADAGDDELERMQIVSSAFDAIISKSKTYGHLLQIIKHHYEKMLDGHNSNASAVHTSNGIRDAKGGATQDEASAHADALRAAESHAAATVAQAKNAMKVAEQRAAIAKSAATAAARAQVAAEAEVIRLRSENKRMRDEVQRHLAAAMASKEECTASQLMRESAAAAQVAAEDAAAELTSSCRALEASYDEAKREVDELNAVLRARTQDITQLGHIIISVHKGEIQPEQLGEIAAGIANIIGPQAEGSTEALINGEDEEMAHGAIGTAHQESFDAIQEPEEQVEDEEDASVPIDSAFYGVAAEEVTWDEPLSVRKTKLRPKGMPQLALDKLAPPPEDPDAAMQEFAYEQQYGKEEAKRMMAEAKAAKEKDGNV